MATQFRTNLASQLGAPLGGRGTIVNRPRGTWATSGEGRFIDFNEIRRQQYELGAAQRREPFDIARMQADIGQTQFATSRAQSLLPYELGQAGISMQRGQAELEDFLAGAGARAAERQFAEAQAKSRLAFLPQFEAARSAVAGRIANSANRPQMAMGQPNWMQSYSVPEFVRGPQIPQGSQPRLIPPTPLTMEEDKNKFPRTPLTQYA
jgi:hypothetical protein